MKYESLYQGALTFFALVVVFAIAVFLYHEVFPEYKKYQTAYEKLEDFRSSYTGEAPAPFQKGIKQILLPNDSEGPELIDRCTSCHVAETLPHFSPTTVALDVNGQAMRDASGTPILTANPDYIFANLEERISQLKKEGNPEYKKLEALQSVRVEGKRVSLKQVLKAHPLIGQEKHPFELHPIEEYGCTSCHSGNGRSLVARRAHGPVFDGEYKKAHLPPKPQFLEIDKANDPLFSTMYNNEPDHDLIFQTTPLLAGPLVEARCAECHFSTKTEMERLVKDVSTFTNQIQDQLLAISLGIENDRKALIALLSMLSTYRKLGFETTLAHYDKALGDYRLSKETIDALEGQRSFLIASGKENLVANIKEEIELLVGKVEPLWLKLDSGESIETVVDALLLVGGQGAIFDKMRHFEEKNLALNQVENAKQPLAHAADNPKVVTPLTNPVDQALTHYNGGKGLFISQSCYACHRIAGFTRASVGPELTQAGLSYPWFIKESIVWPQADLPSSTMPNFRLDHEELGDLMTFLMGQRGKSKAVSQVDHAISISAWEMGEKMPWEEAISPLDVENVRFGQKVFVTEGCAACHKLEGFKSNVALANAKSVEWFYNLFPENMLGSELAVAVAENKEQIDGHILDDSRRNGIIEEIEKEHPGLVSGFYNNFKFAARAFDNQPNFDRENYHRLLHKVLLIYIEEYGMGRDIAPHLNYSGVYRDDAWLMGHFHNPSAYTAKSIMPKMPFDDSKFYALNHMLHVLGSQNQSKLEALWKKEGFNPPLAYDLLCASCHGDHRQGNGLIAEWIYPIPKNLRNPVFLRNLTKEQAIDSITHGVKGTPMPPWGEVVNEAESGPVLNHSEIVQLVDWLFSGLPTTLNQAHDLETIKWTYTPQDVISEMKKEQDFISPPPQTDHDLTAYYFKKEQSPIPSPNKYTYTIKERFYTPENLDAGKVYFETNCASCHGKEGAGTGLRAASMIEAKPRALTNLPWLRTRDDLRLLRAIKFGVPGTAMIPWGDQTTAAMRMQLVMYIRSLTQEHVLMEDLEEALYAVYDTAEIAVNKGRSYEYAKLARKKTEYNALYAKREALLAQNEIAPEALGRLYAAELAAKEALEQREETDQVYVQMVGQIEAMRAIAKSCGEDLIVNAISQEVIETYFDMLHVEPLIYRVLEGLLVVDYIEQRATKYAALQKQIETHLQARVDDFQNQIDVLKAKPTIKRHLERLELLLELSGSAQNARTNFMALMARLENERTQQLNLYRKLTHDSADNV